LLLQCSCSRDHFIFHLFKPKLSHMTCFGPNLFFWAKVLFSFSWVIKISTQLRLEHQMGKLALLLLLWFCGNHDWWCRVWCRPLTKPNPTSSDSIFPSILSKLFNAILLISCLMSRNY
jgi:hypothetical protein